MVAILRGPVHYATKSDDGNALLRDGELLTGEAAQEFQLSSERVRQLCRRHGCGRWEARLRMYVVDRQRLADHLAKSKRKRKQGSSVAQRTK
jgi:hypothetical protein